MTALPKLTATRYVQPLREGGSLPAVVDTDGGLFVVKFRGAGQGAKVLIAELVVGLLARGIGLPVPDLAVVEIPDRFGRNEPDPEIQDLLRKSHGVNFGIRYLDGAFNFDDAAAGEYVSPSLAARIVWFDAFVTNPDRTHRNPNLLIWDRHAWLIDHGSALYAHYDWASVDRARARTPFALIEQHVLLSRAANLETIDCEMSTALIEASIDDVLTQVPDALLMDPVAGTEFASADAGRQRYREYLLARLEEPRAFVTAAVAARANARHDPALRIPARR